MTAAQTSFAVDRRNDQGFLRSTERKGAGAGFKVRGVEGWRMLQASGQILEASVLPLAALATAGLGLLDTDTAVWIAKWILVVELGVIALLAVRKTALPWWQQTLTVLSLVALGLLVIAIKVLAH